MENRVNQNGMKLPNYLQNKVGNNLQNGQNRKHNLKTLLRKRIANHRKTMSNIQNRSKLGKKNALKTEVFFLTADKSIKANNSLRGIANTKVLARTDEAKKLNKKKMEQLINDDPVLYFKMAKRQMKYNRKLQKGAATSSEQAAYAFIDASGAVFKRARVDARKQELSNNTQSFYDKDQNNPITKKGLNLEKHHGYTYKGVRQAVLHDCEVRAHNPNHFLTKAEKQEDHDYFQYFNENPYTYHDTYPSQAREQKYIKEANQFGKNDKDKVSAYMDVAGTALLYQQRLGDTPSQSAKRLSYLKAYSSQHSQKTNQNYLSAMRNFKHNRKEESPKAFAKFENKTENKEARHQLAQSVKGKVKKGVDKVKNTAHTIRHPINSAQKLAQERNFKQNQDSDDLDL